MALFWHKKEKYTAREHYEKMLEDQSITNQQREAVLCNIFLDVRDALIEISKKKR
jgi:hypothetical protein